MFNSSINTRQQGDIGLTHCIFELSKNGCNISIPLTDNSPYDLIIENNGVLYTVQVKSTRSKRNGVYTVQVKRVRPNTTKNTIHKFDNTKVDYVFISVDDGSSYFIPSELITITSSITLGKKYEKYKIW